MFGQIRKEFSPTRAVGIAASEQQLLISSPTESADQRRYGEDNLIARHDIPFAMTSGRSFETEVTTRYVPAENGICKEIWWKKTSKLFINLLSDKDVSQMQLSHNNYVGRKEVWMYNADFPFLRVRGINLMEYIPLCIDISRKNVKFSNTTYILSFRDTDYIFRIK